MYAKVEIYDMYKLGSWYKKLQDGRILVQIAPLQGVGTEIGGGGGSGFVPNIKVPV